MATEDLLEEFLEVLRCSLCLASFTDPVLLGCGHNFCQACVLQHWAGSDRASGCPECRNVLPERDDQALLCVVCKRTKAHQGHTIELLERVARALKEKTGAQLKAMEEGSE